MNTTSYLAQSIPEEEKRYREIYENAPTIVWMCDPDGFGTYTNKKWQEFTGQTLQESLGHGWVNVIHPADAERVHQAAIKAAQERSVYIAEYRLRAVSGEYRWVIDTACPRFRQNGTLLGYVGGVVEVHEHRLAEQALYASNERFKAAIQAVEGIMWTVDPQGNAIEIQPTWEKMTGQSFDEYQGAGWTNAIHPDDREDYLAIVSHSLANGIPIKASHRLKCADGSWRRFSVKGLPVHNPDGAIKEWVGVHTDITEQSEYESRIEYMAAHDPLTHLPNRTSLHDRLNHLVQQLGERQHAVLFMDLNRFKNINDSLGHEIGDGLLVELAHRLKAKLRPGDMVSRFGGDEFVFLFRDIKSEAEISRLANKILASTAKPIKVGLHKLTVTGSIGVSLYPRDGTTPSTLLRHADQAMYQAKAAGDNTLHFFDKALNAGMAERLILENDLRHAVKRKELVLHYQPKMQVRESRVYCLEALVRWNHPKRGMVPPAEFIPVAEEVGLITQIGDWVFEEACTQLCAWIKQGVKNVRVSVNLSAHQLASPYYVQNLKMILKRTGTDPQLIELEITESTLMENIRSYETLLEEIYALGIRMSIDDFGTGYSSLSYLKKLPIQTLKIDRSFIQDVTRNESDAAIVCATISMAQRMGLNIVAEGVETKEHVDFLLENGCKQMQGYYFSRPLAPEQAREFVLKHTADNTKEGY